MLKVRSSGNLGDCVCHPEAVQGSLAVVPKTDLLSLETGYPYLNFPAKQRAVLPFPPRPPASQAFIQVASKAADTMVYIMQIKCMNQNQKQVYKQ